MTCPRVRFKNGLVQQLVKWREEGDRLVVCLDANEDNYKKQMGRALTEIEGLETVEAVGTFTGQRVGAIFFEGTDSIDGVWVTTDVVVTGACVMPAGFCSGDHRIFVLDLLTSSLIGSNHPKTVRAAARRLNTMIPHTESKYIQRLERLINDHRMVHKAQRLLYLAQSKEELMAGLDALDNKQKQYTIPSEKKCRKIKSGRIPFSPEAFKWIRRAQVYRSILWFRGGKIRNLGNHTRAARRCGIRKLMKMSLQEIRTRLRVCKDECNYFKNTATGTERDTSATG